MYDRQPIIICGCHGGGTSYVAKLLRYQGLFLGADAEPLSSRKYHESQAFRRANESILEEFGDKYGFRESTVRTLPTYLRQPGAAEALAKATDIDGVLDKFWGNEDRTKVWGWKDPRNSLTFPIWRTFFPNARAVVVRKKVDYKLARSPSGKWFREVASPWLREQYSEPTWLGGSEGCITVDFERVVTDVDVFNELMHFTAVSTIKPEEFSRVLTETAFEGL